MGGFMRPKTHGMTKSPEYLAWQGLRRRCYDRNGPAYSRYGGRGIGYDKSWDSFAVFYKDMGPRPSAKHSIDRIDNNGDYCKANCRWATDQEQMNNCSHNLKINYFGKSITIAQFKKEFAPHLTYALIKQRIFELKWSVEKTLETPVDDWHRKRQRDSKGKFIRL